MDNGKKAALISYLASKGIIGADAEAEIASMAKSVSDVDIAELYNVETKRINEAVKNNPDKFPEDYMFKLTQEEVRYLRSNNSATNISPKSRTLPNAFTEKGLYMVKSNTL